MVQEKGLSHSSASERSPYEIQIQGELDGSWNEWFNAIEITIEHSSDRLPLTTLHCPAMDQAKLRGILNKIWDMNLNLISVRRVNDPAREGRPPQGSEGFE
jgi:hypothetical protein